MKTQWLGAMLCVVLLGCNTTPSSTSQTQLLTEGIRYCEATLPYNGKLLVGSFGSSELNPLNQEGKGYILEFSDTTSRVLIPADGTLSAPKGLLVKDQCLFIADVGKMVVYNLQDTASAPQVIPFPQGERFVNDMALHGNTLYVTVTNTGSLYSLDVTHPTRLDTTALTPYVTIPGANGIVISGDTMYVASYPPDGNTTSDHTLYYIENISTPVVQPLIDRPGQYDGLALSPDGTRLYFTNWVNGEVGYCELATRKVTLLDPQLQIQGPARLSTDGETLYIPDLVQSQVVAIPLP
ncbi:MAG: hypothetical protein PHV49_02575 [Alistipes sp.]|nr:hypothetical protein [Alistipes sp.]